MAGPFDHAGPRWFSIPAHRPFVEDLARGLLEAVAPLGPEALPAATVLATSRALSSGRVMLRVIMTAATEPSAVASTVSRMTRRVLRSFAVSMSSAIWSIALRWICSRLSTRAP